MKEAFTCASIIASIILCLVGILKLPFKSFKVKHPKIYRVTFYGVSLVLSIVAPIISQLFILNGELASVEFAVLISATVAGVFGLYTTYEGTQLKTLVKTLVEKTSQLIAQSKDKKLEETAKKVVEKLGIEKLTEISQKQEAQQPIVEQKLENIIEEQKTLY